MLTGFHNIFDSKSKLESVFSLRNNSLPIDSNFSGIIEWEMRFLEGSRNWGLRIGWPGLGKGAMIELNFHISWSIVLSILNIDIPLPPPQENMSLLIDYHRLETFVGW